jgi:quercetin dioxygenase-like cupin family protein
MKILPRQPTTQAPAEHFTGDAWLDAIVGADGPGRVRSTIVHFAPGARNAWHSHPRGQTLHVTEGHGRIQARGGGVLKIRAGDTIHTDPGEWHWHGAAPDRFMTHLAIYEVPDDGSETEWGEKVTDDEYNAGSRPG